MDRINTEEYSTDGKIVAFILLIGISGVLLISGVFVSLNSNSSPEMEITSVNTVDNPIVDGDRGSFEVVVENTGDKQGTSNLTVEVSNRESDRYASNISFPTKNVTVDAESSTVVEFDLTNRLSSGEYEVISTLGNNVSTSSTEITVLEPAQFTISDLRIDGNRNETVINPSDDFNVSFTVQNVGGVADMFDATLNLVNTDITDVERSLLDGSQYSTDEPTIVSDSNEYLDVNSTLLDANETENIVIENVSSRSSQNLLQEGESYELQLVSDSERLESVLTVRTSPQVNFSSVMFGNQTENNRLLTPVEDSLLVAVENLGEVSSSFNITAEVNNRTESIRSDLLGESQSQNLVFDEVLSNLTSGEYDLRLTSQTGQSTTRNIEVVEPSNLTFESISFEQNPVLVGEENNISVGVTNTGDLQGSFEINLRLNDTEFNTSVVLQGRETRDIVFNNTTSGLGAGDYSVSIYTDENTSSVESNFSVVEPAELSADNLTLEPDSDRVTTEERVDANFKLQNTGDVSESYQVFVQLIEGEETVQVLSSRVNLQGNDSQLVDFTNITRELDAGEYSVEVVTRDGRLSTDITVVEPIVVNGKVNLDNKTVEGADVSVYRSDELVGTTITNQSGNYNINVRSLEDLRVLVELENQTLQDNRTFFGSEMQRLDSSDANFDFESNTNLSYVVGSEINNRSAVVSYSEQFVVSTVYQLQSISEKLSENYTIVEDINATVTDSWQDGGFELIGSQERPFTGSLTGYDNNTYEISNLAVQNGSSERFSVFSSVENATVQNIIVNRDS